MTDDASSILPFWRTLGLGEEPSLTIRPGLEQLRFSAGQSIIKINAHKQPLAMARLGGYRELCIACDYCRAPQMFCDPQNNVVRAVPVGFDDIRQVAVQVHVRDLSASAAFYEEVLELPVSTSASEARVAIGDSQLILRSDPAVALDLPVNARGWRFITLQVFDVIALYARVLARGGRGGQAPRTVGDIARYALIRDPDGNWIELSQRASLTGPLPPHCE